MERKRFGRTKLEVSRLTFGCGAVGGLMTKGDPQDQDRAVAWAIDHGINHVDTAPGYGNGASETNLGRALKNISGEVIVSTKFRLKSEDRGHLETAIRQSLDASLKRLQRDEIHLFQLHNRVAQAPAEDVFGADEVLNDVLPALEAVRREGKVRFLGFTANGDTDALHTLVRSGLFDSAQIFYNVLTPSAGEIVPKDYPGQDYKQLLKAAADQDMGPIGVRVLAGGALSGSADRHPLSAQQVQPIGSAPDFTTDVERARQFLPLIDEGFARNLPELAIRYVIANSALATTEIGIATLEHLQVAVEAINQGPLMPEALARIDEIRASFVDR